jgi:hypothetical protein
MVTVVTLIVMLFWCAGGQFWKPARRYGIPIVCALYAHSYLLLLMTIPLSVGYGENSWVKSWLKQSETMIRVVMASFISSLLITCGNHMNLWTAFLIFAINITAWKIRAGSLGKIGKYDVLIEDIVRALALSVSLTLISYT